MIVEKKVPFGTKALICVMNSHQGCKNIKFYNVDNFIGVSHHFCGKYASSIPKFVEKYTT